MDTYRKYPRTLHLPWSLGVTSDDKMLDNTNIFIGKHVTVTEKMDGENTSIYRDHIHARSIDSKNHPSRNWVKTLWGKIRYDIPKGWRICGENLYAKHSIAYNNLESYFYGFSIYDDRNVCLSWMETLEWFEILDITPVPVLYKGLYDEDYIKTLWNKSLANKMEGYVIRNSSAFMYEDFKYNVAKFVRPNHVETDEHWMHKEVEVNGLKK